VAREDEQIGVIRDTGLEWWEERFESTWLPAPLRFPCTHLAPGDAKMATSGGVETIEVLQSWLLPR